MVHHLQKSANWHGPVRTALRWLLPVLLTVTVCVAPVRGGEPVPLTAEDIMEKIRTASREPGGRFTFRQDVTLRWMLSSWDFYSEVVRDRDGYTITTYDAPAFVPKELSGALIQVGDQLNRFAVVLEKTEALEDGETLYVLSGERKPEYRTGAERGRIWVRSDDWLIHRVEIHYPWGRLDIRQEHQTINGYAFPRRQEVKVTPLGATMVITYGWFWFDEFLF